MNKYYYGTGKRKCCCARVFLQYTPGNGCIMINNSGIENLGKLDKEFILQPIKLVFAVNDFSIKITVKGGGHFGQLDSIRYGIAKALVKFDSDCVVGDVTLENKDNINKGSFRTILKKNGFMTRDSRIVERKKFGYKKARKKEQYSKR